MAEKVDAIIIGAGMSGMAAGIRLAMYDKKVVILEKHSISGGLNSYYQRAKRPFDVGLHALTNFALKGERGRPLTKLLKQLRIPYGELHLNQQSFSQIVFPEKTLSFTNDFNDFQEEIATHFPREIDGFLKLHHLICEFNETALDNPYQSAREVISQYIKNEELTEMIMCPLLIYGSAWEMDMDFSQFVIMYKSIFLEGFGRPEGGVRTIINLLLKRLEEVNCDVRFRTGVEEIISHQGKVCGVKTSKGDLIESDLVISSAGLPETYALLDHNKTSKEESDHDEEKAPQTGKMSFTESIFITEKKPLDLGQKATIIFYNNRPQYLYRKPEELFDKESAVICLPNNFGVDDYDEGVVRLTLMANYHQWASLERNVYKAQKEKVGEVSIDIAKKFLPNWEGDYLYKDIFSPTTIKKYTSHFAGTVYGSPDKTRDGRTHTEGLIICGTDQGFLGIVGSMLSGISMANLYGLMNPAKGK